MLSCRWKILRGYLGDAAHADNVRTKEEINRQNKNIVNIVKVDSKNDGAGLCTFTGRYTTDDGYL